MLSWDVQAGTGGALIVGRGGGLRTRAVADLLRPEPAGVAKPSHSPRCSRASARVRPNLPPLPLWSLIFSTVVACGLSFVGSLASVLLARVPQQSES